MANFFHKVANRMSQFFQYVLLSSRFLVLDGVILKGSIKCSSGGSSSDLCIALCVGQLRGGGGESVVTMVKQLCFF
jgi:hypothetical protein